MSLTGEHTPYPIAIDPAKGGVDRPSPVFDLKPQPWTRGDVIEVDCKIMGRRIFIELNHTDDVQEIKKKLENIFQKCFELWTKEFSPSLAEKKGPQNA